MPRQYLGILLTFVLVALLACNLPLGRPTNAQPSNPTPPAALTSAAQTMIAAQNQGKSTTIPPALLTAAASTAAAALTRNAPTPPPPTNTATPSPQPSPSLTPTITPTPTPSTPMISVSVNTNCRTGPGDAYNRVGALLVGEEAEVLARDPYGQFWYIPNPDRPGGKCWVWGQYATITGDTASLPVFTPPPTPTPAPAFVIKGVTARPCCGPDFFLEISNTGEVRWESYRVEVTDLDTAMTDVAASNAFTSTKGICGPANDVPSISPGDGAYISYYNIGDASHRMRFVVTLYTKDGQSGMHVTHTVEYHP